MGVVIRNAWLLDIDPLQVRRGELRLRRETIAEVGPAVAAKPEDEIVDAGGAVVMPGLVNGHGHLYSALATGMPPPSRTPASFHELLELVWWRLDRALDLKLVTCSGAVGAIEALRCGTTTIIDHHSSPNAIDGSLEALEAGVERSGLRAVLCYETTDRNGSAGRKAGIEENARYLKRCAERGGSRFAGLVGGHAGFTLSDEGLAAMAALARRYGVGAHLHAAEDPCDDRLCRELHGRGLLDRLEAEGILATPSILAHGTHLTHEDRARLDGTPVVVAHNPRSNMNNSVGYAMPAVLPRPVLLGTDGIGGDMFAELQAAWLIGRHAHGRLSPSDCVAMLANSAERASQALGVTVGRLTAGAAADVIITDYYPSSPLENSSVAEHLLYGLGSRHVKSVLIAGQWRLRDRTVVGVDVHELAHQAALEARRLWDRMAAVV